jgi:hypothetical protein
MTFKVMQYYILYVFHNVVFMSIKNAEFKVNFKLTNTNTNLPSNKMHLKKVVSKRNVNLGHFSIFHKKVKFSWNIFYYVHFVTKMFIFLKMYVNFCVFRFQLNLYCGRKKIYPFIVDDLKSQYLCGRGRLT